MAKEIDFYKPIKKHFQDKGFDVKAEIKDCDCVCIKDDIIVICEFKLNFNISLVYQGLDRQKITDYVYLCIPRYKGRVGYKNFVKAKNLVKRLGLGLILVNIDSKYPYCEEILEPIGFNIYKNPKKKQTILKEFNGRKLDLNEGGQTGVKINTAFKERCIKVLCVLEKDGKTSNKDLISKYGFSKEELNNFLYNNSLRYFVRTEQRGYYKMSKVGENALNDVNNKTLVDFYRDFISRYQ